MPKPTNILIHEFDLSGETIFDADGDEMLGFYYQFTDENEEPVSGLMGPYRYGPAAEKAAIRAFKARDF